MTIKEPLKTRKVKASSKTREKIEVDSSNILHIDSRIKLTLLSRISVVPDLQRDLTVMLWIMKNGETRERFLAQKQVDDLRRRILDLQFGFEYGFYILRTQTLLDEYRTLEEGTPDASFMTFNPPQVDSNQARRNETRLAYLRIAREYIEIDNLQQKARKMTCPNAECGGREFIYEDEDSSYACKTCGTVVEILDESPSFKDTDRINMSSRYRYSLAGRFIDTMKKFQGKQNKTIPPRIYEIIEQEMKRHRIAVHELVKDQVYMFLSDNGLSSYYEDINLIYSKVTNTPAPDISEHTSTLLDLFMVQEEAYGHIKDPDRKNSMNVWYKMYKLLQRIGYPCRRDDFYFLKTRPKEDEHDEKMKEAWDRLGWKWIPT